MEEPRLVTVLWAFAACYGDSFDFLQWFLKSLLLLSKGTRMWEKAKWHYYHTGRKLMLATSEVLLKETYVNKNL
jgi:hypothetical protein